MELKAAREIVEALADLIRPDCERLEIAGSIRRNKAEVKDGEIVAIGKPGLLDTLDNLVSFGVADKALYRDKNGKETTRWGPKYRGLAYRGMKVEIFMTDADNWGYQLWLRTGPAEANKWLMQWLSWRNAPIRAKEGSWWHGDHRLSVPDEEAQFRLLGMPVIPPAERADWYYKKLLQYNRQHRWPDFSAFYAKDFEQLSLMDEGFTNHEEAAITPSDKAQVIAAEREYLRQFSARMDALMERADRGEALLDWEARYVANRREWEANEQRWKAEQEAGKAELVRSAHELEVEPA